MNPKKTLLLLIATTILSATYSPIACAQTTQSGKLYQLMTPHERSAFVAAQARRIAREMSGNEYQFTPAFEEDIHQAVTHYAKRIRSDVDHGKRDVRLVFERGQVQAPTLMTAFSARHVSPLIGLYLPFIESEYTNIEAPNSMGAIGMFQFLPQTGERYGLSRQDLLDVTKSADAAARYILDGLDHFKNDPMKEALALLAYNRGTERTARDLKFLVNEQNKQCSICALSADRGKLDETFRHENVYYVPRFFAAAIIGENPQVFGLGMQPLSSY